MYSGIEKRHLARLITLRRPFDSASRNTSASDMPQCLIVESKLIALRRLFGYHLTSSLICLLGGIAIDKKQSSLLFVGVAQLVEHGTHKPGVAGALPAADTKKTLKLYDFMYNSMSSLFLKRKKEKFNRYAGVAQFG